MKKTLAYSIGILIGVLLGTGLLRCCEAHADCDFVWKPGDTIYVEAGRPYHVIVESDYTEIYQRNSPVTMLPVKQVAHGSEIEDAIRAKPQAHWCGEYEDLTDEMVQ